MEQELVLSFSLVIQSEKKIQFNLYMMALLQAASFQATEFLFVLILYLLPGNIRQPPLLSGHGYPVAVVCLSFSVIFTSAVLSSHP